MGRLGHMQVFSYKTGRVEVGFSEYGRPLGRVVQLGHSASPPFGIGLITMFGLSHDHGIKMGVHTRFFPVHSHTALPDSTTHPLSPPVSIAVSESFSPLLVWLLAGYSWWIELSRASSILIARVIGRSVSDMRNMTIVLCSCSGLTGSASTMNLYTKATTTLKAMRIR